MVVVDESDRPEVTLRTSCYNLIGYGKGCGWNKDETTQAEKDWAVKHEPYNAFADFSKDVTMFGNGCDNTVLKCKGSHALIKIPGKQHPNHSGEKAAIRPNLV